MSRERNHAIVLWAGLALALGGILYVLGRTGELPHADAHLAATDRAASAVPTDAPATSIPPGLDRGPSHAARVRATEREAPATNVEPINSQPNVLTIRGRVVTADGAAVAGADITLPRLVIAEPYQRFGSHDAPFARTRSASDGTFLLEVVSPAGPFNGGDVTCAHEGFATRERSFEDEEEQRIVDVGDLILVRGARLRGYVRDRDGLPIEGARVIAVASEVESKLRSSSTSIAGGSFEVLDAPSGEVQVSAQLEDGRRSVDSPTFEVAAGGALDGIELVVPIPADSNAVLGVVLDVDGSPLSGAPVAFVRHTASSTSMFAPQLTDTRGRFRLQGQPGATFRITAEHPRGAAVAAHVEGVESGRHDVVLRLTAARDALLRVRDTNGAAIERFAYRVRVQDGPATRYGATGELARHSGGEIAFAVPGSPFHLALSAPGYASTELGPHDPAALPAVLEATLQPLSALRGRVLRRGAPVEGAVVRAQPAIAAGRHLQHESFVQVAESCHDCPQTTTDVEGAFVIEVDRPSDWWFSATSGSDRSSLAGQFSVSENELKHDLVLDVGPAGAIEGRVRDTSGRALVERKVRASRGDGVLLSATTDAHGDYRFDSLAPGPWQVRLRELDPKDASSVDARYVQVTAVPPIVWDVHVSDGATTRFDIVVPEPARLVVTIAASTTHLTDATWRVSASRERVVGEPQRVEARVGALPSEHVLELPASGEWVVRASTDAGGLTLGIGHTLTVPAGTSALGWDVPDGAVRGRLKPEFPLETRIALSGRLADGTTIRSTVGVQADGAFEFPFAITGDYELAIDGNRVRRTNVTATAGQMVDAGEL